jgi:hypothetical protein
MSGQTSLNGTISPLVNGILSFGDCRRHPASTAYHFSQTIELSCPGTVKGSGVFFFTLVTAKKTATLRLLP